VNLGRTEDLAPPGEGIKARQRRVLPIVEFRTEFEVSRAELEDASEGAPDIDLGDLDGASRRMALCENVAVFHGYPAGGIVGISQAVSHPAIALQGGIEGLPTAVASAVSVLLDAGISGHYALVLSPERFTLVNAAISEGGVTMVRHLQQILGGGHVVRAPGITDALVLSQRGGDFFLDVGEDLSIGYLSHTAESVRLFLEESFTFRVMEPDAGVAITG